LIQNPAERKKELIKLIKSPNVRNMLKSDVRAKKSFKAWIRISEKLQKEINLENK
jgi:hypothetical protein